MKFKSFLCITGFGLLAAISGCSDREETESGTSAPQSDAAAVPITNRIAIPQSVRDNLGITFAKVEQRAVTSTLRVPGEFELLPSARRQYHAVLPGRVELLVGQYEKVEVGKPLYRIDSSEWQRRKMELEEALTAIKTAQAEVAVADAARSEAVETVAILQKQIEALGAIDVKQAELDHELARVRNTLPRLDAELKAKQTLLEAAEEDYPLLLSASASLLGISTDALLEELPAPEGKTTPRWRTLETIEVLARESGVIEIVSVTNGSWAETATPVLVSVNPDAIRFRAAGLQSDLGRLRDGLAVRIVPAQSDGVGANEAIASTLSLGLAADPQRRTMELFAHPDERTAWSRAGVAAFLEISLDGSEDAEPAVPASAIVKDDLDFVFFRRDTKDPDKVIRMEADLGPTDGRWVAIRSGVKAGDEVVVSGAYDLNLLGGGDRAEGGHFHPDGTFHPGED